MLPRDLPSPRPQATQRGTEDLTNAVKEKWGRALDTFGVFGNRTKEAAASARTNIGEELSTASRALGETGTGA